MSISVLSPELVSKIAAGEVVERPASVVKELIENSLDAGATRLEIVAEDGGASLVRVVDNGQGIAAPDIELAFHRYATSKISSLHDLDRVASLGFRGEALPSIAAVADVEVLSAADSDGAGTYLRLTGGRCMDRQTRPRRQGTTITVRGLFRHVPGRLKFLRSSHAESGQISNVVVQYALAFPGVSFSLRCDGRSSVQTSGRGDLRDTVREVYGIEVARAMLDIDFDDGQTKVWGLASSPGLARSSRRHMSFFVNHRSVRSALLTRAAEGPYNGLLPEAQHPVLVAHLLLPANQIDVNVHPTKAELRFLAEQSVFAALQQAVMAALGGAPVRTPRSVSFPSPSPEQQTMWTVGEKQPTFVDDTAGGVLPVLRVLGQLSQTYVIAEGPEGLYLIDQHAAHERILYERITDQWSRREVEVQGLLQPVTVELSPREDHLLQELHERLHQFGFHMEQFGQRSYLLRAIPSAISRTTGADVVRTLLEDMESASRHLPWEKRIATCLACHGAVKAGQTLAHDEMRQLVQQLETTRQPRICPHGRPTIVHLSSQELEREFGRTN